MEETLRSSKESTGDVEEGNTAKDESEVSIAF